MPKGLTGNTVLHYHVLLRKALEEAKLRGLIRNNPTDRIPRPKKEPSVSDCYSPEECRKLLNALHDDPLGTAHYVGRSCMDCGAARFWGCDGVLLIMSEPAITISHSVTVGRSQWPAAAASRQDKVKRKSSFRTSAAYATGCSYCSENAAIQRYGTQPPPHEDYICVNGNGAVDYTRTILSEQFQNDSRKEQLAAGFDFMICGTAVPIC